MKKLHVLWSCLSLCVVFVLPSCTKDDLFDSATPSSSPKVATSSLRVNREPGIGDKIVLGAKLDNPYSVKNMQLATDSLFQKPPVGIDLSSFPRRVSASHYYVRFKPKTEEELAALKQDTTLLLYEYPLDYELLGEGISYHDPEIPDSLPTYQYAAIEAQKWNLIKSKLPVEYNVLENLYIPDEDELPEMGLLRANDLSSGEESKDWLAIHALVDAAMKISGNEEPVASMTRGYTKWRPAGTITAYDDIVGGPVPLKGVKVRARRWCTTHVGYTNSLGYFSCNGRFERPANYSIVWESGRWDIRDGSVLQAYYNGPKIRGDWNLYINSGKSVRYATIHRAAHRFYYGFTNGLSRPNHSRKEKIAYHHKKGDGITGDYNQQSGLGIWSDIRIYGVDNNGWRAMSEIFSTTCHELGHAAHYTRVGALGYPRTQKKLRESWARCVQYVLTNEEYKSLDVFYDLNKTEAIDNQTAQPPCMEIWMIPDCAYNFQDWNTASVLQNYTPLFIDLIDKYNQRGYYKLNFPTRQDYYDLFPNDVIHDMPVAEIERIVFGSKTFSEVKSNLIRFAAQNPYATRSYNLSLSTINNLFTVYEKQ